MQQFTDEEFEQMILETTNKKNPRYDMLRTIAERFLRKYISRLCGNDSVLSNQDVDDLMEMIICKLIQTSVTRFLKRGMPEGQINRDKIGFLKWMYTVAKNTEKNYAKAHKGIVFKTHPLDDYMNTLAPDHTPDIDAAIDSQRQLSEAFNLVLSADIKVYKSLTWLAFCLVFLTSHFNRWETTVELEKRFSEMTLYEMSEIIFEMADVIPWMQITTEQKHRVDKALLQTDDNGTCYGDKKYKDFYMKKGGKASISDWIYRINKMIQDCMLGEQ